jgi:hypothetical protein
VTLNEAGFGGVAAEVTRSRWQRKGRNTPSRRDSSTPTPVATVNALARPVSMSSSLEALESSGRWYMPDADNTWESPGRADKPSGLTLSRADLALVLLAEVRQPPQPSKHNKRQKQDRLLKCLQGGQAHALAGCGVAALCCAPLALLETENPWANRGGTWGKVAYEHDEDFRSHLPTLFHVAVVSMDSVEGVVRRHTQQLLINLVHSLAVKPLERAQMEHLAAAALIRYLQSMKGHTMWAKEQLALGGGRIASAAALGTLADSLVHCMVFDSQLRAQWGGLAAAWAAECDNQHLACRSHQVC